MPPLPDNTEAELDAFEAACERLHGFESHLSFEFVDGYLTGVAAGPRAVPIDEWLPLLCGDTFDRCFADPHDAQQARDALGARYRVLRAQLDPEALLDDPEALRLNPLVVRWDDATRQQVVDEGQIGAEEVHELRTGRTWLAGLLSVLEDFRADWVVPAGGEAREQFETMLAELMLLDAPDDSEALVEFYRSVNRPGEAADGGFQATRDDLLDMVCFVVQDLRLWWLDHAARPPTRHVDATPGRNDPCPCGSGKKYKKCHGTAG